jgi:hypothetical protein
MPESPDLLDALRRLPGALPGSNSDVAYEVALVSGLSIVGKLSFIENNRHFVCVEKPNVHTHLVAVGQIVAIQVASPSPASLRLG